MFQAIDRLAGWWIDWRIDRALRRDQQQQEYPDQFKKVEATEDGVHLQFISPAVAVIADEAAQMLNAHNADNYVQFDMLPRFDRGLRAIRVTVQWAGGESPAAKAKRLQGELDAIRSAVGDGEPNT